MMALFPAPSGHGDYRNKMPAHHRQSVKYGNGRGGVDSGGDNDTSGGDSDSGGRGDSCLQENFRAF